MDEANRKAYKKESKDFLIDNIDQLNRDCEYWAGQYKSLLARQNPEERKLPLWGKFGSISLDFWPPTDWLRFGYQPWGAGKYAQLTVGPLRIDWVEG